jgi:hypothetical protein
MRVNGKQNEGIIVTSDDTNAVRAVVTNCDTEFIFCGGSGVEGTGYGFAAGVSGVGTNSLAGVSATEGAIGAVYATSSTAGIPSIYASSSLGTGVNAFGEGAAGVDDCGAFYCAGLVASGDNGVLANTSAAGGYALYGEDSTGGSAYGLVTSGDGYIVGDLTVTGTCTGCVAAVTALNASGASLSQGDAVALVGVRTAPDGSTVLVVRAAKKGDQVLGVVDRALSLSGKTVKALASVRKVWDSVDGEHTITTSARDLRAQSQKWLTGATSVAADGYLRVVISGVFTMESTVAGAAAGDSLAVGDTSGRLGKAGANAERGTLAGKYLGKLEDGRTVLLVDPS